MRPMPGMTIGRLAELAGCSVPTVRYYEEVGLLPSPDRKASGHRVYDSDALRRLLFVKRCRDFDFPIDQMRVLAQLLVDDDRSCVEVRDLAMAQLVAVRTRKAELEALEQSLEGFVESCDTGCSGGPGPSCAMIEELSSVEPKSDVRLR